MDHTEREVDFTQEKIQLQLEKILSDQLFNNSVILKSFLRFIVQEKLAGRSNCLKEYTIGVNILNKPKTFKPQENGIVRIHAGRLRRALDLYYSGIGLQDEIRIFLPKGHYEPFFIKNTNLLLRPVLDDLIAEERHLKPNGGRVTVSVSPFHYVDEKCMLKKLSEGLGVQLTTALSGMKSVSVISFNMARLISDKLTGIHQTAEILDVQYIFTGYIQAEKNKARITIELFRTDTSEQVWSRMFEKKISEETLFEIQDELTGQIIDELQRPGNPLTGSRKEDTMMAVA